MKQIGEAPDHAFWSHQLVGQLSFIRQHMRFPVNRRTLTPLIAIALSAMGLPLIVITLISRKPDSGYHPLYWLIPMLLAPVCVAIFRYFRNLRFVVVPARPLLASNLVLLERFFGENHFAYGQHADAPEVFQMLSKNLGRKEELREVLIFIVDDHRILLNSHFVGNTFGMPVSSGHSRSMARMLKQFLETQSPETTTALRQRL